MNELYTLLIQPFYDYGFMRRALVSCLCIAISGAPLGVFLVLRRMTLVGDGMAHAILPGVSLAFLFAGVSLWHMTIGGLITGLQVAIGAALLTRHTPIREDASFTGIYLLSLATGVLIISSKGSNVDLLHVLFGNVLAIDPDTLQMVLMITSFSLVALSIMYRGLIIECYDPGFMKAVRGKGSLYHQLFLALLVFNLVAAFQAMGSMMALGLMILPAIAARLWARNIDHMIIAALIIAILSTIGGLLWSFHTDMASGPTIVIVIGIIYAISILFGPTGGVFWKLLPHKHLSH
ncbi:MAG: metal ABC transporter permease [Rickettsiales bacterium]|nr:metal ABC transporter permease [Rickettsiales bacterium]